MNNAVALAGQQFTAAKGGYAAAAMQRFGASGFLRTAVPTTPWRTRPSESIPGVDHELPPRPVSEYSRG